MKTTSNNYKELVAQGKNVVNNRKNSQRHLADLALKACTIRHGGRHGKLYTIKEFAKDIKMNANTLSKYIQERRVEITINKNSKSKKKKTLTEIKQITRILRKETRAGKDSRLKYVDFKRIMTAQKKLGSVSRKDLEITMRKLRHVYSFLKSHGYEKFTDKEKKNLKILLERCNNIAK